MSSWDTPLPGLGHLHTHCVGGTAHTVGIDHHFHAEGAEKAIAGYVRFCAVIEADGQVSWSFVEARGPRSWRRGPKEARPTEHTQKDFPAEAVKAMRAFSERLDDMAPSAWVFSVMGAVDMELRQRLKTQGDAHGTVEVMSKLLKDNQSPREVYVDKATGHRPATQAERQERRAEWTRRRDRAIVSLAEFEQYQAPRVALLQALRRAISQWCKRETYPSPPPKAYLADAARTALKEHSAGAYVPSAII